MSGVKLRLMCLVWPDDKPDEHIVQVNIDDDDTVASLKDMIKDIHKNTTGRDSEPHCQWQVFFFFFY